MGKNKKKAYAVGDIVQVKPGNRFATRVGVIRLVSPDDKMNVRVIESADGHFGQNLWLSPSEVTRADEEALRQDTIKLYERIIGTYRDEEQRLLDRYVRMANGRASVQEKLDKLRDGE